VHSTLAFRAIDEAGTVATVTGRFVKFAASLESSGRPESIQIEATIDASSLTTDDPERDKDLLSADFLDAALHPSIEFRSSETSLEGDGMLRAHGDLILMSRSRPVTLSVAPLRTGTDRSGAERIVLEAKGAIAWADSEIGVVADLSLVRDD
jgi:polyisoprenoid-binding protein YceI